MGCVSGLQSILQCDDEKKESHSIKDFLYKSFKNAGFAAMLTGSSLFSNYSNLKIDSIPKNHVMEIDTITKNSVSNEKSYVFTGDFKNLNLNNPMSVAGINLKLPDTCSAWNLIKSLDTLTIRTKVNVFDARPSNENNDIEDFSKLCELAVNYTIKAYSKVAPTPRGISTAEPFPITVIPQHLDIRIYSANDSLFGSYTPYKNLIKINNYYIKFSPDANAFALFTIIAHETVHLLYQLNNPKQQHVDNLTDCYDVLIDLGIPLNRYEVRPLGKKYKENDISTWYDVLIESALPLSREEIELFLKQNMECEKETEKEAFIFQSALFKTLFKGILEDTGVSIKFNDAYLNNSQEDIYREGDSNRIYAQSFENIKSNISKVSEVFPVLNKRMLEICLGKYNDINKRCEKVRKKYLDDESQ